jgi:ketosteroid isomerase-like protein
MWKTAAPALLALAACYPSIRGMDFDPYAEIHVAEAIHGMYEAFKGKTLDGVARFMTEDSTCYDVYTSTLLAGRKAVLDHFGTILARHKEGEKWESSIEDMKVDVRGDLAVATYKVRTSAGGGHALAAVTHVFRREGRRWLACHLHRSWNTPN